MALTKERYRELTKNLSFEQRRQLREAGLTVEAVLANYPANMRPLSTLGWSLILPCIFRSNVNAVSSAS